jgi:hypothetical protein
MLMLIMLMACKEEVVEEIDYSVVACELLAGELIEIQPALLEEEAAQSLIVPSDTQAWLISNVDSSGYITIEVEDWMGTLYLFANEGVELDIPLLELKAGQSLSTGCEGFAVLTYTIQAWGSYPMYFQGEGDVQLSVIHP